MAINLPVLINACIQFGATQDLIHLFAVTMSLVATALSVYVIVNDVKIKELIKRMNMLDNFIIEQEKLMEKLREAQK